jgi:hypothetical protein
MPLVIDEMYHKILVQAYENSDEDLSFAGWLKAHGYDYEIQEYNH